MPHISRSRANTPAQINPPGGLAVPTSAGPDIYKVCAVIDPYDTHPLETRNNDNVIFTEHKYVIIGASK
jgi:hypothetical protein